MRKEVKVRNRVKTLYWDQVLKQQIQQKTCLQKRTVQRARDGDKLRKMVQRARKTDLKQ